MHHLYNNFAEKYYNPYETLSLTNPHVTNYLNLRVKKIPYVRKKYPPFLIKLGWNRHNLTTPSFKLNPKHFMTKTYSSKTYTQT